MTQMILKCGAEYDLEASADRFLQLTDVTELITKQNCVQDGLRKTLHASWSFPSRLWCTEHELLLRIKKISNSQHVMQIMVPSDSIHNTARNKYRHEPRVAYGIRQHKRMKLCCAAPLHSQSAVNADKWQDPNWSFSPEWP